MSKSRPSILDVTRATSLKEAWWTGPHMMLWIVGHGLYLAWLLLLLCGPARNEQGDVGIQPVIYGCLCFAGMIITLMFCWMLYKQLSQGRGLQILALVAVVLVLGSAVINTFVAPTTQLLYGLCLATGLGAGCLSMVYNSSLAHNIHNQTVFSTMCSFIVAGVLALCLSYLEPQAITVAMIVLPVASALLYVVMHSQMAHRGSALFAQNTSKVNFSWKSYSAALANCTCIGFAAWYTKTFATWPVGSLLLFAAVAVASFLIGWDAMGTNRYNEKMQLRAFLPCAAVGIIPIAFVHEVGRLALVIFMFFVFIPQVITNLNAVAENCQVYRLNPVRVFGIARIPNFIGLILGLVLGYLSFDGRSAGNYTSFAVSLIIIFVFIILASFVLENHYPEQPVTEPLEGEHAGFYADIDASDGANNKKGIWKLKCEILANRYDLSPRQREVLFLLAKGRNAAYIEEKLVVSNHTAKAHIYNIYKKIGVHSRQELISMIEAIDIEK